MESVEIRLLGCFEVRVDGEPLPAAAWGHARSRDLVKLLALWPGHRVPRERVVEELWPHLDADAGLANLHKAAHHGRRALGDPGGVVLREGQVMLAPEARVETDVERFEAEGDPGLYGGELLPDDRYAAWTQDARSRLLTRYVDAMRAAGRWEAVADHEPADEPAQRAVMGERMVAGDRAGALRAYGRLVDALAAIGLLPSIESVALHARVAGGESLHRALAAVELELATAPIDERPGLLATRADLLLAVGDRGAPAAYAEAAVAAGPDGLALRIRQAWAQLAAGDPESARSTLAPLQPRSDAERIGHLIASAGAAWFTGDLDAAQRSAEAAEQLATANGLAWEARAAVHLQAMVAHTSGTWKEGLRHRAEDALRNPAFADTIFDGHICVAEYSLGTGESPNRIRALAEELHGRAVRAGARRAQAFAATLLGEVALVAGALDDAEGRLREAIRLSREISAVSAEALAGIRLGDTARARGDQEAAEALYAEALVVARWSPMHNHLPPLAYAARLRATDDPERGRERLDEAEAYLRGFQIPCAYCGTVFAIAGTIAAARAGQTDRAAAMLGGAEARAAMWMTGPWPAIIDEGHGELALARGERDAIARLESARDGFAREGWRVESDRVAARLALLA